MKAKQPCRKLVDIAVEISKVFFCAKTFEVKVSKMQSFEAKVQVKAQENEETKAEAQGKFVRQNLKVN